MQHLSVSIITFNEEKNIARCLDSVKDLANEIIVVDSLSTDKTEAICKQYGVKFISQKFLGYIEQKNFALEQCKNKFVLCLDADECLDDNLKQAIKQAKQNNFIHQAYTMNRCTNFCGKWIKYGTWYPDNKLRLFDKTQGKWGGTNPHDRIIVNQKIIPKKLNGDLLHYSYYTVEEVLTQQNKFTTIQAKAMFDSGKRSSLIKLFLNPLAAFLNGYILKKGFLNGADGFFIASTVSYNTMVKYFKLLRLQQKNR